MKILLLLTFLFSLDAFAAKTADSKLKEAEVEAHLATAKARQIEDQLSESELLKTCKEQHNEISAIEGCIQDKFSQEGVAEEFADRTNLRSFDLNASKNSTSIRNYLSERLRKALYGDDKDKKLKKLVDHTVYSKLYRSQIGKNILVDVSNYCLVNLGLKNKPYVVVNHCIPDEKGALSKTCTEARPVSTADGSKKLGPVLTKIAIDFASEDYKDQNNNGQISRTFTPDKFTPHTLHSSYNMKTIWKNLYEYELSEACLVKQLAKDGKLDSGGSCAIASSHKDPVTNETIYTNTRNSSFLNAAKEIEFKLGSEYMRGKYQFCAFTAIKNMCEVYRCRNVYHKDSGEEKIKYCVEKLDFNEATLKSKDKKTMKHSNNYSGSKACSLVAKLKQYRKNIATLDVIDKHNSGLKVKNGLSVSMYQGGTYGFGNKGDEKSIEEITTISSNELAGKSELGISEDERKELEELCFDNNGTFSQTEEKCQQLLNEMDGENAKNVSAEIESETQLYLKRIEGIKDDDQETVKEYLIKHGLTRYMADLESGALQPGDLKKIIADEYKSERDALKKSMMDKYNRLTKRDDDTPPPASKKDELTESDLAKENIENLAKQKETIQTLFQYNNVISSYMSAQIGEGEDAEKTELSYQRDIELKGMSEFGDDEAKTAEYTELLEDDSSSSGSGNEQMNVDLNFIDTLLGNKEDEEASN